jgi:UDP-2,4-diacetamido-2,4,6-trideoxy-beta-L-altropyranose hydrolase
MDCLKPIGEVDSFIKTKEYEKADTIIIDSYYIHNDYIEKVRANKKIVFLDDLMTETISTDILVNYNLFADKSEYDSFYQYAKGKPEFILGTEYVPLREEFSDITPVEIKEQISNVLILTGGADPCHVALGIANELANRLKENGHERIKYHFVVGTLSQDYDELSRIREKNPDSIELHRNVSDMKSLMISCDLAISAAGSTLYELCACGVPTITYVTADNQIKGEEAFLKNEIMLSAGDVRHNQRFYAELFLLIEETSKDNLLRKKMADRARKLADGKGAERIASEIIKRL